MKIYIFTPPAFATGGVELLQQLAAELNRICPGCAYILYIGSAEDTKNPVHKFYEKYENPYVVNIKPEKGSVIIVPEIWVSMLNNYSSEWIRVIWWESVDNYFYHHPKEQWFDFADNHDMIHLAQSEYARDFLLNKAKVSKDHVHMVSDYLNSEFIDNPLLSGTRRNRVLYNPAKGMEYTEKLMNYASDILWKPLANMTPSQIREEMSRNKVYIDFGNHPGKDRMPREACISGCCVITGLNGSAAFYEDIPVPDKYKFSREDESIPSICRTIRYILENYQECKDDFEVYREMIRKEKDKFQNSVKEFLAYLEAFNERKLGRPVRVAIVKGDDYYDKRVLEMIDVWYNKYLDMAGAYDEKLEVAAFVRPEGNVSGMWEGYPLISMSELADAYENHDIEAVIIPLSNYIGQSSLVTDLIKAGIGLENVYCVERDRLDQNECSYEEAENLFVGYMDCK